MFLSGTGAVVALVLTTTVQEATVGLLTRIRAALKPIFDDDEKRAKLPRVVDRWGAAAAERRFQAGWGWPGAGGWSC